MHKSLEKAVVSVWFEYVCARIRQGQCRSAAGLLRQGILTGEWAILLHLVTVNCKVSSIFTRCGAGEVAAQRALDIARPRGLERRSWRRWSP
jgi:hypothetical protein